MVNLEHQKIKKKKTFNKLIEFINIKYSLEIKQSLLDKSSLLETSWFTGFTEAEFSCSKRRNMQLVVWGTNLGFTTGYGNHFLI